MLLEGVRPGWVVVTWPIVMAGASRGPLTRNVDPRLITPAFGEALRADGLDPER